VLDLAVGWALFPDGTPPDFRFENQPAGAYDRERTARIQSDGDGARWVRRDGFWRLGEIATATVNVSADGERRTVGGAPGGLRVAVLGGSAAFGLGQADDATVASALARSLAATALAPAEVRNFGMIGWTAVDAAADLEVRLARGEEFDVVVSFSGANEMYLAVYGGRVPESLVDAAAGDSTSPSSGATGWWLDRSVFARLTGRAPRPAVSPLKVARSYERGDPWLRRITEDFDEVVSDSVANYRDGVDRLDALAARHGFSVVHVLQPLQTDSEDGFFTATKALLAASRPGVLDLSGSIGTECFYDNAHFNEVCAAEVGAVLADEIVRRSGRQGR